MVDVEAKRALASELRGVSYDARTDRFTAEIYVGGVRRWLGSHITADEAAAAYEAANAERGPAVRKVTAFSQVYADFRQRHGGDRTDPPEGAVLEYDGQQFVYVGHTWRRGPGKAKYKYALWDAACKTCGAAYRVMSPFSPKIAKGITRNCPEHVKTHGFKRRDPEAKALEPSRRQVKPVEVVDEDALPPGSRQAEMKPHLDALSAVKDTWPLSEVAQYVSVALYGDTDSVDGIKVVLTQWSDGELKGPADFAVFEDMLYFD